MISCVIIASKKRVQLLDEVILPSVLGKFEEILVVGDYHLGDGYKYLPVPSLTNTTIDALVKRDVGTLASRSPWIFYLSDDHAVRHTGPTPRDPMTIGVPARYSTDAEGTIHLCNAGLDELDPNKPYCGGHAGLFSKALIAQKPWTSMPHHPNWDLFASRIQMSLGATLEPVIWQVEDMEPLAHPWR